MQIGSGSGSLCGKVLWDPALCVLIDVLSGKTELPQPVPEVAGPSAAPRDSLCLQQDLGVAAEGEMGPLGRGSSGPARVAADRWLDNDQKVHLQGKEVNAAPWK